MDLINPRRRLRAIFALRGNALVLAVALTVHSARAGSATWVGGISNDWNTAANWTPPTVPNGASDTATFSSSPITSVVITADTVVNRIVFNGSSPAYTIAVSHNLTITFLGISDTSTVPQTFAVSARLTFDSASAGKAHIHNLGASVAGGPAGITEFAGSTRPSLRHDHQRRRHRARRGGRFDAHHALSAISTSLELWSRMEAPMAAWAARLALLQAVFLAIRVVSSQTQEARSILARIGSPIHVGTLEGTGDIFLSNQGYPITVVGGNGLSCNLRRCHP